ncbi:FAR1-related sequence 5-like protein [Tanacetum coccineum]
MDEKEVNKRNGLNKEEVTVKISCDTVVEDVADRDTVIEEVTECMRTPRPTLYEQNETPGGSIYWEPHVEGIPIPVEGTYYDTIDEALDMYMKYAEIAGFEVKKGGQMLTKSGAVQHNKITRRYKVENYELLVMFWADEVAKCNYKEFGDIESQEIPFESLVIPLESYEISLESHVILLESHVILLFLQIFLVIPFESYEISLESDVILVESQEILLESHVILLKSHPEKISLESHVILVESQEILLESHVILLESHVILLFSQVISLKSQMIYVESHEILFESHEIQSESHEIQNFKERFDKIVWNMFIEPLTFEEKWAQLIEDFDLKKHKWLTKMFNLREIWIPAYFIDSPLFGLMRTTSRSESENSFFKSFTSPGATLVSFMMSYESAMERQRFTTESHEIYMESQEIHIESQEISLESQMIEVESQEIHTESHEISLESHGYFLI